jgi:hypothetical protein
VGIAQIVGPGSDPVQVLDRVTLTGRNFAIDADTDVDRTDDFSVLLDRPELPASTSFVDCTVSVSDGLFCIDNKEVVNFANVDDPTSRTSVFSCENSALGLDTNKRNTCTALDRDAQKTIFLGGKQNGKSNLVSMIIAATPDAGSPSGFDCPAGFTQLAAPDEDQCVKELASGRPLIEDIDVIEGDIATVFAGEKVLSVLEERKTWLIYSDLDGAGPASVNEIAGGKDWNLRGKEQVLNVSLLPYGGVFYGLATTTNGRILAVNTVGEPSAEPVFDLTQNRELPDGTAASACPSGEEHFDVTVSAKTGLIYALDSEYCLIHVLTPVGDGSGGLGSLEIAMEGPVGSMTPLTLSTNDAGGLGSYPATTISITPGITIDLSDFTGGNFVTAVSAPNGQPGLQIREIQLAAGSPSGAVIFQVTGFPDCRWIPEDCADLIDPLWSSTNPDPTDFLRGEDIIVDLDPVHLDGPAYQLLNMTPLMPSEITDLFPDGLPPMLQENTTRAAASNAYLFDMFFVVTEAGVTFERTFEQLIDVQSLLQDSGRNALGCFLGLPNESPLYTDMGMYGTLNWDIVTSVSEKYPFVTSATGQPTSTGDRRPYVANGAANYESRVINSNCTNPPRTSKGSWSAVSYGMELTPCTAMRNEDDSGWIDEGTCLAGDPPFQTASADEAVIVKNLLKLYKDWRDTLNELACTYDPAIDGGTDAPIDDNTCATLNSQWENGLDKLVKGLEATLTPKTSQGNENLGAFHARLNDLLNTVTALSSTASRPDLANRKGLLESQLLTLQHINEDRVGPSITAAGFGDTGWVH